MTEREQHWREQVVTFFGCVLNLLLVGAGTGLAIALGIRTVDPKSLIATAGLGIYAGVRSELTTWLLLLRQGIQTSCS